MIIIVLGLLIYLALQPKNDKKYLDLIKEEEEKITKLIEINHQQEIELLKNIQVIEKKETIIRNYYNEIIKNTDTITTIPVAVSTIRQWLDSLSTSPRFEHHP